MLKLTDLKINYLTAPVGITGSIALSWVIESNCRNVVQTSYQVQVLRSGTMMHDSGIVFSSQSAHIRFCLNWDSLTRYCVRVRVTAGTEQSNWLEGSFVTGFQDITEWQGQFISAEPEIDCGRSYGTMVRKEFMVNKKIKEAWLTCSAHGLYHSFLNGERVSKDEMAPGWTSYNKRLLYQTYDVTGYIHMGKNAVGIMLGAGWYKGLMGYKRTRNHYGTRTAFGGQIILRYIDGTEEWICTDTSWKGTRGPVKFSEIYGGETYDARMEQDGWNEPDFHDSAWAAVEIVERDIHTLFPQTGCPVRVQETIKPASILTTPEGDTVLDFGQNMTGWCEIILNQPKAGALAELEFFEVLDSAGNVYTENLRGIHETIRYICRGKEKEIYRPWFTFQGFQYAKIISFPTAVQPECFTAHVVHSDMQQTGTFSCSSPLLNQLHHNILWGMKGNFLDVPTDCPQRDERLGWTGDVQVFARTSNLLMNTNAFYHKWLADVAADQNENGAVSHVVPDILTGNMEGDWLLNQSIQGGASGWGDVAVILPWALYQAYGDTDILNQQMGCMLAWIRFMHQHSDGCLFRFGAQFGDWLALDANPGSYKGATPDDYVCAAYYCYTVGLTGKMLDVLKREEEARHMFALAQSLRADFQCRFFQPDGSLTVQTQTAHVLALAFHLVPEPFRQQTVHRLTELLQENNGYLATGFLGTPYLLSVLSENGCLTEAYSLLLKEDFPSWLYQVKAGATTIWEHWDGRKPDGSMWSPDMNSFNHYAYGAVGEWLYRTIAGIEIDTQHPGYSHFYLKPQVGGGLAHAKAEFQSIHGKIVSGWHFANNTVTLTVEIPANTSADIILSQALKILDDDGLKFSYETSWKATAGSGQYTIVYQI